ncbi:E1-E2 ATPase family protein (macronuclear) [Tetrahymena thermophila SB210]|uniref:Cation-transporting ATPase n=1 Tax=Tetrahymena thermophila (strain SB210) TaxID=312017 RepID=Q22NH9_TETTS|nr:E1-E2 ATPase family protein [Tetrahymena thermophila SB210]EAR86806.2 E1-E2 ATPase family protein [Tetrahymena thermophila SB210]|eukprot:XP_001007051.2 E1-E2 ATPase family protein [Tetrahymena thermophila SB210]
MKGTMNDSLLMSNIHSKLAVNQSNVEGECLIENITLLRVKKLKLILAAFLSLITAGLFLLLLRWFFKIRKSFLYKDVNNIKDCTHVLVDNSDQTKSIQKLEKILLQIEQVDNSQQDEVYCFENRMIKYIYYNVQDYQYFQALEYPVCKMTFNELKERNFLDENQAIVNKQAFGQCQKLIDVPSLPYYLFKEMTSPFYFLQYISIVLWVFESYIQFSIIIFSVSLSITILNYILMRISLKKIQQMAHYSENATLLRKDVESSLRESIRIVQVVSKDIVVGDIIILQDKQILPCDCVLISGEALLNEVSLTGESLPIPKYSLPSTNEKFSYNKNNKKYILYEGTEIYQSKSDQNKQVLAKVIRVGFHSFKGQILRSVLYPKPIQFDYYKNSMKYILGLLVIVLIIYFSMIYRMYQLDFPVYFYLYRFFDTVTWIIPPFLPIFVSLSQTLALMRLKSFDIYGIDPQKTFISGKITHMCFDKTGTLTQNGMNVIGYYNENLDQLITHELVQQLNKQQDLQHNLFSTCHGVYLVNDNLVGDMLDVEMVKFSEYNIQNVENDINIKFKGSHPKFKNELQVIRMFEFSSDIQTMSCVAYDSEKNQYQLFLKGSPEKVQELCDQSTIPNNFQSLQNSLSIKGFRIIAMAHRQLNSRDEGKQSPRESLEKQLNFLGFLIFENKLKDDTSEAIQSLKEAQIECKIISGDNPLTTLQAGVECGILNGNKKIYYVNIDYQELKFYLIENQQILPYQHESLTKIQTLKLLLTNDEQLVITGKVLDFFYNQIKQINNISPIQPPESDSSLDEWASENKSINNSKQSRTSNKVDLCQLLIQKTIVFSRMRPEQKRIIIEIIQSSGKKVGMIGDGSNDCAAIKQGDIGISFAAADAAFSAPFSSSKDSISCVVRVLLEGRCTMTVNIEIFRTIVTQNVMKYIGVMVLLQEAQNFGGFQYTYLSFMCGMPLLVFLALSKPSNKLQPYTPDDKFQGLSNCLSMYSQFIIFGFAFIIGYFILTSQNWHVATSELEESNGLKIYVMQGELNSIIFLMINVFYMSSCLAYYVSHPYKQPIYKNIFLFPWIILSSIYGILVIIKPEYCLNALNIASSIQDHTVILLIILATVIASSGLVLILEELIIKKYFGPKTIKQIV